MESPARIRRIANEPQNSTLLPNSMLPSSIAPDTSSVTPSRCRRSCQETDAEMLARDIAVANAASDSFDQAAILARPTSAAPREPDQGSYGNDAKEDPLINESSDKKPLKPLRKDRLKGDKLICVAIDDDPFLRVTHRMFFMNVMKADMAHSGAMGVSDAELTAFSDVAMGRRPTYFEEDSSVGDSSGMSKRDAAFVADVLFIDHDLGLGSEMMGTELARRVHAEGFPGLICIVTAASREEHDKFQNLPHVHLVVEKGFRPAELEELIWSELLENIYV